MKNARRMKRSTMDDKQAPRSSKMDFNAHHIHSDFFDEHISKKNKNLQLRSTIYNDKCDVMM